jgi:hypothetical protein
MEVAEELERLALADECVSFHFSPPYCHQANHSFSFYFSTSASLLRGGSTPMLISTAV